MPFAHISTKLMLINLGVNGLPEDHLWNSDCSDSLAIEMIKYFTKSMSNVELLPGLGVVLSSIIDDDDFSSIFAYECGEYTGNKRFAQTLISRIKSGELMWSNDCVAVIEKLDLMHKDHIQ